MKNKMTTKSANEISELVNFSLGGFEQKVLIEGKNKNLPVVITLHGGPGTPIPFSVGCRGLFPEFTEKFIMVYWDQLGCGINNRKIDDSFSIESFVAMTEDLICEIKKKFPENKIYIFATSWGSILSAKLLEKNPSAVDGVVVAGQIIKNVFICDEVKNALRTTKIPKIKMEKISRVTKENFTGNDLQLISSSLRKYTNAYQNKNGEPAPVGKIIKGLLKSPDYKFKDFKAIIINGYLKNNSLWKEIIKMDLSQIFSKIKIPYIFLQGETDIVASTETVKNIVEQSGNKNLQLKLIPDTGHFPGKLMMENLLEVLSEL